MFFCILFHESFIVIKIIISRIQMLIFFEIIITHFIHTTADGVLMIHISSGNNHQTQYENDCSTYFWEHVYKVIDGQETMEDLDAAVQTALDMGMTEIIDAYNHSYQEYLAQNS